MKSIFSALRITLVTVVLSAVLLVVLMGLMLFVSAKVYKPDTTTGINNAQPIITALETYKKDTGDYPQTLISLVTHNYLSSIPTPDSKGIFEYQRVSQEKYVLWYMYDHLLLSFNCYYSNTKQWNINSDLCYE